MLLLHSSNGFVSGFVQNVFYLQPNIRFRTIASHMQSTLLVSVGRTPRRRLLDPRLTVRYASEIAPPLQRFRTI